MENQIETDYITNGSTIILGPKYNKPLNPELNIQHPIQSNPIQL